ncbi:hypothetical protein ACS0TY_028066 [Phlomoides rotata]
MSQGQPRKPQAGGQQDEPIKYGDVFPVSGDLAKQPVAPKDAAVMQSAETRMQGQTQKRGPAAASTVNDIPPSFDLLLREDVVRHYIHAKPAGGDAQQTVSTIGEALEAAAQTAGNKPVDHSDAAAIQAAECRATGSNLISPGGLAAVAQSAAAYNDGLIGDEGKVKLRDILTGVATKFPADKAVTREDAEEIMSAELRNDPEMKMHPGGVAESVTAAATKNEQCLALK